MKSLNKIPKQLRVLPQWVCWSENKVPRNPKTGGYAKSNDPNTWSTFDHAIKACVIYGFDGVGFMFREDGDLFGVDLDNCLDNPDFVNEFVDTLQSYAEISKSGKGIHIICKGHLPDGARRHAGVEMYSEGRYFICTGNIYNPQYTDVIDCTESIKSLHSKYLPMVYACNNCVHQRNQYMDDDELLVLAKDSKNGLKLLLLMSGNWDFGYSSQSEADLALCAILAYWTGKNSEQIDRIFRSSGLMRPKWDEKRGKCTYGQRTIAKAVQSCSVIYEPNYMEGIDQWLQRLPMNK